MAQSFDQLYANIYNALTNNKILGIDQQKIKTINGQLSSRWKHERCYLWFWEVRNKTQKWTIFRSSKTDLDNGLIF